MPSISQLKYILAVDRTKNFSRAAKECHVSQPSLSAQIQKVEEDMDFIIFDRSKKPVITTLKGRQFVDQAKEVLKEHSRLYDIKNQEAELSGEFQLAVIPTLAPYLLPLFVENFAQTHPKVQLNISEMKTEDILRALYDDQLDGAILVTPLYDDKIIERHLFFEPFFVYASTQHELANKKLVRESDLDANSVWLLEEGHCFRDQVIRVCSLKKQHPIIENVRFSSGSLETLINFIRRGDGYTLLPYLATLNLSPIEKEKSLKRFQKPVPTREVSLIHSRSFLKQEIIDQLEKSIVNLLPKEIRSLKRQSLEVIDI